MSDIEAAREILNNGGTAELKSLDRPRDLYHFYICCECGAEPLEEIYFITNRIDETWLCEECFIKAKTGMNGLFYVIDK